LFANLGWREVCYRKALHKYRFGVTAEVFERETGAHIELRNTLNLGLDDTANDSVKRRHPCYYALLPNDDVHLIFNDFHELIGIRKATPLARWGFFREEKVHPMFAQPLHEGDSK